MRLALALLLLAGCTDVRQPPTARVSHTAHTRAGVHCKRCHQGLEQSTTAAAVHLPDNPICVGCHADAHPGKPDRDCVGCHVSEDARATLERLGAAFNFNHAEHVPRMRGDCIACHRGAVEAREGGAIPQMADCDQCHREWTEGLACARCHASMANYPLVPVSHQAHAADFMRRHGQAARAGGDRCGTCHSQSFCAECHDGNAPITAGNAWPDRPDRAFVHGPSYLDRHAREAKVEGPMCVGCHGVEQCRDCHEAAGRGLGDASPHPRGWASPGPGSNLHAAAARQDLLQCASCHGGSGGDLCADCHAVGRPGGSPHGGRRPLGDPQRDRPCVTCHRGLR